LDFCFHQIEITFRHFETSFRWFELPIREFELYILNLLEVQHFLNLFIAGFADFEFGFVFVLQDNPTRPDV